MPKHTYEAAICEVVAEQRDCQQDAERDARARVKWGSEYAGGAERSDYEETTSRSLPQQENADVDSFDSP